MAETTVYMGAEASQGPSRYVYRATVAGGDTLNVIGLPSDRTVNVKVYPSGSTVSVYATTDTVTSILAGTANKILWPNGAVTDAAEDTLNSGHTGVIISAVSGTVAVELTA